MSRVGPPYDIENTPEQLQARIAAPPQAVTTTKHLTRHAYSALAAGVLLVIFNPSDFRCASWPA